MVSVGILLKGSVCRVVTLTGTKKRHDLVAKKFHKLELAKTPTQEDVEIFVQALKAFCSDNSVDLLSINYRNTKGDMAGGAATFRIEGIILATSPAPVKQVHSSTLAATTRKHGEKKSVKPTTVDLGRAYDLAFEGLE
jgi:hypothetical protein